MAAAHAHVIRDGERQSIPAAEVVPGDIIVIEEGDTIPADGRLIESTVLKTAEASLTGESLPVSKDTAPITGEAVLGDRTNMVYSGTAVYLGRGRAVIVGTGMNTEMGRIAGHAEGAAPEYSVAEGTRSHREGARPDRHCDRHRDDCGHRDDGTHNRSVRMFTVLILGVALAVAAVPEGLPAVVTTVLSIGVQRMARRNAIVRHLTAVETLGSANIIASDKTGT